MIPDAWRTGEVAVLGLGRSGDAVARLLRASQARVYASDAAATPATHAAAEALRATGVDVQVGGHDLERIKRGVLAVTSPGIPPDAPPIRAAHEAGVPLVGEIEIALAALPDLKYIVVTGTNGKSTVTAIIGHLLKSLGLDAEVAGNIGRPLADVALQPRPPRWVALEISSYQLHDTPSVAPTAGVLTNLAPDHLDRYASVDAYYADKVLLFRNATSESRWVVNFDDAEAMRLSTGVSGYVLRFSGEGKLADAFYDPGHDKLIVLDEPLLKRSDLPLLGAHNVGNALAAALAVVVADPAHTSLEARHYIAEGLRTVRALPHRLEAIGEFQGVLWINDSKATNVASARVGIDGMLRPTILLLGGRHKGEPYTALIEPIRRHCKTVLVYGEAADIIQRDLSSDVPLQRISGAFEDVIAAARQMAEPGDCVLMSPACSSFDMFANYEERGMVFATLARGDGARSTP